MPYFPLFYFSFVFKFKMSKDILSLFFFSLDQTLLENMGIRLSRGPTRIPLYAQKVMVDDQVQPIPGMIVSHIEEVPDDLQALIALILQIVDGRAFRRLVHEKKKTSWLLFALLFRCFIRETVF